MHQLSLIALYGQKKERLLNLISECQKKVADIPGIRFQPYDVRQIHGTVVGLARVAETRLNLNMSKYRNRQENMDFSGLLSFIRMGGQFPFQVQIGGFQNREYPFTSLGQRPYERSFQINYDKIVLIGWPIRGRPLRSAKPRVIDLIQEARIYPNTLDDIRRTCQTFNVLHRYHGNVTDIDNDFYFRIGILDSTSVTAKTLEDVQNGMKAYLASVEPIILEITVADIYVACYEDEELSLSSTQVWSISNPQVTPEFLWTLYK
jgi:hypothetical protein